MKIAHVVGRDAGAEDVLGDLVGGQPADEVGAQLLAGHLVHPAAQALGHAHAHGVPVDAAVEDPGAVLGHVEDVGEQGLELQHLDAALSHEGDEVRVVRAGPLHVEDVVEEELVAVRGREEGVCPSGCADHDGSQPPGLGPDSVG